MSAQSSRVLDVSLMFNNFCRKYSTSLCSSHIKVSDLTLCMCPGCSPLKRKAFVKESIRPSSDIKSVFLSNDTLVLRYLWYVLIIFCSISLCRVGILIASNGNRTFSRFPQFYQLRTFSRKHKVRCSSREYLFLAEYIFLVQIMLTILGVFTQSITYGFPNRVAHCTVVSVLGRNVQTIVTVSDKRRPHWARSRRRFCFRANCSQFISILNCCVRTKQCTSLQVLSECRYQKGAWKRTGICTSHDIFRYQLSENIRVLRFLLPVVMLVCVFFSPA